MNAIHACATQALADPLAKAIDCLHKVETQLLMGTPCLDEGMVETMLRAVSGTLAELASEPAAAVVVQLFNGRVRRIHANRPLRCVVIANAEEVRPNILRNWGLGKQEIEARKAGRPATQIDTGPSFSDRIFIVEEGEACRYALVIEHGRWSFPIRVSGWFYNREVHAFLDRIVRLWNANLGIPSEQLPDAADALRGATPCGPQLTDHLRFTCRRPDYWIVATGGSISIGCCPDGSLPNEWQYIAMDRVIALCNAFVGVADDRFDGLTRQRRLVALHDGAAEIQSGHVANVINLLD
jgi:hypothetical protein